MSFGYCRVSWVDLGLHGWHCCQGFRFQALRFNSAVKGSFKGSVKGLIGVWKGL